MSKKSIILAVVAAGLLTSNPLTAGDPDKTQKLVGVLQSEAGLFEKARACQQLGEIGTKEAVPALAALLADEHLNAYARSGLENIPDPSAAAALRDATARLKGKALIGVINSLGVLRDAQAVPLLRKLAGDPGSGAVKEALLALGRVSNAESIQVIRQALLDGPEAVRPDAAAACLLAAERQWQGGSADSALALYEAVRNAKVPLPYRVGATRGAILARKEKGVPFLIEQLRSDERAIRHAALLTVREIPGDALANALNAELATANPELEVQLLNALVDCHNAQSIAAIRARFAGGNAEIRKLALSVLGKIGGPDAAKLLLEVLLDNRSAEESAAAATTLGRMEDKAVDDLVVEALPKASQAGARVHLIRLAESRGATSATGDLLKLAGAPDVKVSLAACNALASLAGAREFPALIMLVATSKDANVREAAEQAVISVGNRTGNSDAAGQTVLSELAKAVTPELKNSWIRILTSLGHAKALPAIKAAMNDANESVAANAIEQLGRWPDPAPVEDLLAVVEKGANAGHRQRALDSVIRLATVAAEEQQRPADVVVQWFQRADKAAQTIAAKRRILSGLGRLKHPESFRLIAPYLDREELRTEAAAAAIQVVPELLKQNYTEGIGEALAKIVATVPNPELRKQAEKLAKSLAAK